ncbi:lipid A deacylase LpxR family protein [Mesonia aquimarina]|uniref:lipid A deacylase LpxR family protein n=1 Tax=Mesonia aquimarina TaxID=1504967 RepID=UPI000EF5A13B|nr:lipid A deacylase LpxR family protein [Mesonia aquimarina]
MKTFVFICILILCSTVFYAQKIDNIASYRSLQSDAYFRLHYDNDYFTAQDQNYTQGYAFELVLPVLAKNPVNYLFFDLAEDSKKQYGLALEHIGFTPEDYGSPEIQFGDRPFAAAIYLKSFTIETNTEKSFRFSSSISLGVIGPAAFGEEMQTNIHEATGNTIPIGWRNQIENDLVLNYEVSFEKKLYSLKNNFLINSSSSVQIGSLFTNANLGLQTQIGLFDSPFTSVKKKNKFQIYFYTQALVNAIVYDATLQGGLFTSDSPYVIESSAVSRLVGEVNYGIVMKTGRFYLEYTRTHLTKEFKTGSEAKWGGLRVGFRF